MIKLPTEHAELRRLILDLIEKCKSSASVRAAYCRAINTMVKMGKYDGAKSKINLLNCHLERTAAHIYSPTDLRFAIDFENEYPDEVLERGRVVSRSLTRNWERNNTDMEFGQGVYEALKYGSCFLKQWTAEEGPDKTVVYHHSLVMPWNFGVYREDRNDLKSQEVMVETMTLSLPEVWSRIWSLPDAKKLFDRVRANASKDKSGDQPDSYFHQILSSSQINTGVTASTRPVPGGIVQLANDPNYAMMGPHLAVDLVRMHELWIKGEDDYVTVQMIEPDIIINPLYLKKGDQPVMMRKTNALVPGNLGTMLHPYTLIQPNREAGWMWGRPELFDLFEPQGLISQWADDVNRLFGLQIDKVLGFSGFEGITDETYDQMKQAGYFNGPMGAQINDITPAFPPEAIPMLKLMMDTFYEMGGFPPMMRGQGESGVRAGTHANTLLKTGSPGLRDKSLLVERQCAGAADLTLSLMEAKEAKNFWTKGSSIADIEKSKFLLSDLPADWRVAVDSHSSSPIFADDHAQLVGGGVKMGFVDPHSAIDMLPFPNKEILHARLKKKEQQQQAIMQHLQQTDPEAFAKLLAGGRKK